MKKARRATSAYRWAIDCGCWMPHGLGTENYFPLPFLEGHELNACEFCTQFVAGGCALGIKMPKGMSCREFEPTLEKFCSKQEDFVNARQLAEMATFFGFKGPELKKVRQMAACAESARL